MLANGTLLACVFGLVVSQAQAGVIIAPTSATTDMGSAGTASRVINQSGLSTGYTSGVTDFDTYISLNSTHNNNAAGSTWLSDIGSPTGNFDFTLGGSFTIDKFALWNVGGNLTSNIIGFMLLASDDSSFSTTTTLGGFTANPNTGSISAVVAQVFTFTPTQASFVRMQITSNNGGTRTSFAEAAFDAVPEPSSLALVGLVAVGFAAYRKRRKP